MQIGFEEQAKKEKLAKMDVDRNAADSAAAFQCRLVTTRLA